MIFLCNNSSEQACFHDGIFALTANAWLLVSAIVPSCPLFLFNADSRMLHVSSCKCSIMNLNPPLGFALMCE